MAFSLNDHSLLWSEAILENLSESCVLDPGDSDGEGSDCEYILKIKPTVFLTYCLRMGREEKRRGTEREGGREREKKEEEEEGRSWFKEDS